MKSFSNTLLCTLVIIGAIMGGIYLLITRVSADLTVTNGVSARHITKGETVSNEIDMVASEEVTVADLLLQYTKQHNIKVEYKDYGGEMGLFIQKIAGVPVADGVDKDKWWQFWVNNEYSNKGASSVMLKVGDRVSWRYTNSQQ